MSKRARPDSEEEEEGHDASSKDEKRARTEKARGRDKRATDEEPSSDSDWSMSYGPLESDPAAPDTHFLIDTTPGQDRSKRGWYYVKESTITEKHLGAFLREELRNKPDWVACWLLFRLGFPDMEFESDADDVPDDYKKQLPRWLRRAPVKALGDWRVDYGLRSTTRALSVTTFECPSGAPAPK